MHQNNIPPPPYQKYPTHHQAILLPENPAYFGNKCKTTHEISRFVDERQFSVANRRSNHVAEHACNWVDQFFLKDAKVLKKNFKDGADRIVNGIQIQTKFCKDAASTFRALLRRDRSLRYLNADGSPMLLEVPRDQFEKIVALFQREGFRDTSFVKKAPFTYDQVVRIGKRLKIESIVYDSSRGIVFLAGVPLTFIITFAIHKHGGFSTREAGGLALLACIGSGILSVSTSIIMGQASKAGVQRGITIVGTTLSGILLIDGAIQLSSTTTARIAGAMTATAAIGLSIIVATALSTAPDAITLYKNRMSKKQFGKHFVANLIGNTSGAVGGAVGGAIGGAVGTAVGGVVGGAVGSVVPIVGTISAGTAGGFIGGVSGTLLGGTIVGVACAVPTQLITKKVLGKFIPDDSALMREILDEEMGNMLEDYIVCEAEHELLMKDLKKIKWRVEFKTMYSKKEDSKRIEYVRELLSPYFERLVERRDVIRTKEVIAAFEEAQSRARVVDLPSEERHL